MPTTSSYPNINHLLNESLKQLERFINFPRASTIFQQINEQLKAENIDFDPINTYCKVHIFFLEIKILVENEYKNLNNLVSLINAYCDSEPEKQNLNYLISLRRKRLQECFDSLNIFKPDDLDSLNDLVTNKSNKFLIRIINIFNSFTPECQYEEYKNYILNKFNFLNKNTSYVGFKEIISDMINFKDSHEIFQSLLRQNDSYQNQLKSIVKVQLNLEKINLIKEGLDILEKNIFQAIYEFNPLVKSVSNLKIMLNYRFDKFNSQLIELKEANRLTLIKELGSLKLALICSIKAPVYTFTSVLLRAETLIEVIANLTEKVQTISEKEDGFNEYYKQYLALKSEISELAIFSHLKAPFDKMFTHRIEKQINKISAYKDKLYTLADAMANEKAKIFDFILKELRDIKNFEHDDTKFSAVTLAKTVSKLVATLDENISTLSKHRNMPFKNVFWCLFGIFRPATTSLQLIKAIKKGLNQFNSSIQGEILSLTP